MPPRSALITGGSSGIGLAAAAALHAAGYRLTLVGRRAGALDAAAARLGTDVAVHADDLADPDAAQRSVAAHVAAFGGLDALVAAAGNYELTAADDLDAASWDATLDVHLRGAVLCAAAAAPHLRASGRGRIVLLSSVNGFHSEPGSIAYSAGKAAIISVARSLAVDLAGSSVTANAVAPGWVHTPMTETYLDGADDLQRVNPLGRAGTADEIAAVIRFLVVDAPEFLTGTTIVVDGGQTALAPMP